MYITSRLNSSRALCNPSTVNSCTILSLECVYVCVSLFIYVNFSVATRFVLATRSFARNFALLPGTSRSEFTAMGRA